MQPRLRAEGAWLLEGLQDLAQPTTTDCFRWVKKKPRKEKRGLRRGGD